MKLKEQVVAHHEAGHFVAAVFLDVPVKHVTITPDADSAGHNWIPLRFTERQEYQMSPSTVIRLEKRVMVALAGCEAQRKFRPSSVRSCHGASDREKALAFVRTMEAPNAAPL